MTSPEQVPEHLSAEERECWEDDWISDSGVRPLLQTISMLRGGLKAHAIARDDWLNVEFPEFCNPERTKEAKERIAEHGGRIAYIAWLNGLARKLLDTEGKG